MSDDERHTTRNTVKFREGTEPKNGISIICQGADRFYDDWSLPFFLARKLKSSGDRRARVCENIFAKPAGWIIYQIGSDGRLIGVAKPAAHTKKTRKREKQNTAKKLRKSQV